MDSARAGQIEVAGTIRTFTLAPAGGSEAPLLVALHGTGSTGAHLAGVSGLAERGPQAGITTVFPDGLGKVWDGGRAVPGREGIDDTAFLVELIARLGGEGVSGPQGPFVVGMSNGAFFAEHLARHRGLPVAGIALVAGTATAGSAATHPVHPTAVLCFAGTADPVVPYRGGPIGGEGPFGRVLTRLAARRGEEGLSRVAVGAEELAAEWAALNRRELWPPPVEEAPDAATPAEARGSVGATHDPATEQLSSPPGELRVVRSSWVAPGCQPVILYRIEGGGHTWPGGPQYLPAELVGPVARHLDATGIILDAAARAFAAGR